MQGLIVYATHTGNTYMVASEILRVVTEKVPVLMKQASKTTDANIEMSDLLIIGSSSWDWKGNRGYPIDEMMRFLEGLGDVDFSGKKIVLFGCGDTDYEHFCGALSVIEEHIKQRGGSLMMEPLKIDKYYLNEMENKKKVTEWAEELVGLLE